MKHDMKQLRGAAVSLYIAPGVEEEQKMMQMEKSGGCWWMNQSAKMGTKKEIAAFCRQAARIVRISYSR